MGRYARRLAVVTVPATLLAGLLVPLDATAAGATVQAQVTGTSAGVVTVSPEANQADVYAEASVGQSITLKAAASGLRTAWWILVDRPLQSGTRIGTTQATETTMQLDVPGSYSVEAAI
ncbi:MAG: hypothetical protein ACRD12_08560, partial [Acidimicrobiales bacterium]